MREPVDQAGHEFDEGGLGRFIAERAIIALHPELQRAGHRDRLLEAERRQMVEQARILRPCGVVDLRQFHRAGRIALEQLAVMSLHDVEMAEQILRKGCPALIAEEVRKALDGLGIFGQRMGLLVRDHLQPVLDAAQELVSRRQFVKRPKGDPVAGGQDLQRVQRRTHPQFRVAAAGNELLRLREKLDLADAAAADLDVMAFDRDLALAAIGLHLPLHVVDVGKRGKIQMLAPDERRKFCDQRLARFGVAGAGARLDHRGALPGPPFPLVIMQRRLGRHRHLRRGRIGPQAQIDAEHIAVAGALLQQAGQRLRHAHEERRRLDVGDQRGRGGIEKHDQVDVAGIVQFARAHLAHREHDQAGALLRPVGIEGGHAAARDLLAQQEAQGGLHGGYREVSQRCRHPHHRPDPADVAQRDQQRGL